MKSKPLQGDSEKKHYNQGVEANINILESQIVEKIDIINMSECDNHIAVTSS